ncbi:phosphatase PAP2 family protein [Mucilaginibacter sp. PAMB04274]|uniref:phosphatase PAP2 family protein n=1 Tax=Mucilaginibacter sp. PAMB04274 TaxID=3138568 RepID=UPI0031F6BC80
MKNILLIILFMAGSCAFAQQTTEDTTKKNVIDTLKKDLLTVPDTVQHLRSKFASLIPPAALMGYGITSFYVKPLRKWDRYIYKEAQEHNIITNSSIEDYFQYAPVALVYGLNVVGVHGKNTFVDRTLIYVLSQGMLKLSLNVLKRSTHRLRPNELDRLSFPSGHTGTAFSGAEFMAQELSGNSPYYGLVGYAFATTTGVFRIYHQDHWFSDVVAGAGLGILATKGAYLLYPYIRNTLFRGKDKNEDQNLAPELKKKARRSAILLPSYQSGGFGVEFAMEL